MLIACCLWVIIATQSNGPDPQGWMDKQVQGGLDRLLRTHFIRRFPLIFDGGFLKYSYTFTLPRPLTASLTHLLHLSKTYDTPLANQMRNVIKLISQNQEQKLHHRVQEASMLISRRSKKKRNPESQESTNNAKRKRKSPQENSLPVSQEVEDTDSSQRTEAYLQAVHNQRSQFEGEGSMKTERRLNRIVGDVIGCIGRSSFECRRKRCGKLSYGQVPLVHYPIFEDIGQEGENLDDLLIEEEEEYEYVEEENSLSLEEGSLTAPQGDKVGYHTISDICEKIQEISCSNAIITDEEPDNNEGEDADEDEVEETDELVILE
ncbi:uncharacterized protein IL334_005350 [Kwoniella shivajii]|uniref:HNH nuclease domain-containing protein n=1 Tax=Kwoniella shivajii TaxID=564305 RepID=A0ABZ1D4Y1_9TREE|nr:hypothetical protein IL334_005350 [Kwoniella shivajii]